MGAFHSKPVDWSPNACTTTCELGQRTGSMDLEVGVEESHDAILREEKRAETGEGANQIHASSAKMVEERTRKRIRLGLSSDQSRASVLR